MRLTLNGKLIGLAAGFIAGLLFVFIGWQAFLILLGFIPVSYTHLTLPTTPYV